MTVTFSPIFWAAPRTALVMTVWLSLPSLETTIGSPGAPACSTSLFARSMSSDEGEAV
ncbi:hypothetical protein GCM10010390_28590 [Streptomyces mordarskii]|uniref:Uncharacterized protein n=1 Tax=Streptomyces mordarskii TaxID=1226758 RepID=A0ABP3MT60_9ACTN